MSGDGRALPSGEEPGRLSAEAEGSVLAEAVDRIAHQLKNPLQAMTVNLEVIRMRAGTDEPGEVRRLADVVDDNVRRVDRRIRMLIALARRSPDEPASAVDLGELLREADEAFRLGERRDGPGLRVRLPDDAAAGTGDLAASAREGGLLALLLTVASRAAESRGDAGDEGGEGGEGNGGKEEGGPYLAAGRDGDVAWIEIGPGAPWRGEAERDELAEGARLAGGELAGVEGDRPPRRGPVRVLFPRA